MARPPEQVEFAFDDREVILARMVELERDHRGWINLEPDVEEADLPEPRSALSGLLWAKGPDIPVCTWAPGELRRGEVEPTSIGIQHASGPKAVARLRAVGIEVAPGWRVRSDHPRRGLVIEVPPGDDPGRTLDWLLTAGTALATVPVTRRWHGEVYAGA